MFNTLPKPLFNKKERIQMYVTRSLISTKRKHCSQDKEGMLFLGHRIMDFPHTFPSVIIVVIQR